MTKAVNLLPLVSTDAKSSVNLEVEVAQSITNPNTDGSAYVDDFEGSKQTYPLGLSQATWFQCSPPTPWQSSDSLLHHPPAWRSYWYEPLGDSQVIQDRHISTPNHGLAAARRRRQVSSRRSSSFVNLRPARPCRHLIPRATRPLGRHHDLVSFRDLEPGEGQIPGVLGAGTTAAAGCTSTWATSARPCRSTAARRYESNLHNEDPNNTGNLANDTLDIGLDGRRDQDEWYCVPDLAASTLAGMTYGTRSGIVSSTRGNSKASARNIWAQKKQWPWGAVLDSPLPVPRRPEQGQLHAVQLDRHQTEGQLSLLSNGTEKNGVLNTEDRNSDGFKYLGEFFPEIHRFRQCRQRVVSGEKRQQLPGERLGGKREEEHEHHRHYAAVAFVQDPAQRHRHRHF